MSGVVVSKSAGCHWGDSITLGVWSGYLNYLPVGPFIDLALFFSDDLPQVVMFAGNDVAVE